MDVSIIINGYTLNYEVDKHNAAILRRPIHKHGVTRFHTIDGFLVQLHNKDIICIEVEADHETKHDQIRYISENNNG